MSKRRTFLFQKLARDKILDKMMASGDDVVYHILEPEAFEQAVRDKIVEEAIELQKAEAHEIDEELADVRELLDLLAELRGQTEQVLRDRVTRKRDKRGGFEAHIYISQVTTEADGKWITYLASHSDQYPEVLGSTATEA